MKLKICGLSNSQEINVCVDNGVDYCGFILNFPKSHRFISFDKANELTKIEKKIQNMLACWQILEMKN